MGVRMGIGILLYGIGELRDGHGGSSECVV